MSSQLTRPTLNVGNHIYLYRLLRESIGVGKQTFITQAEEALAAVDLTAEALGFGSTRELMEALDDFVTLTVFKGGRIYVTVTARTEWDEALGAADADKAGTAPGGKPWKRKKGAKQLKAVRPRTIQPKPEPEPEAIEAEEEPAESTPAAAAQPNTDASAEGTPGIEEAATAPSDAPVEVPEEAAPEDASASDESASREASSPDAEDASEKTTSDSASPAPAYSLTVIYDPEHANAGITTLESTPSWNPCAGIVDQASDQDAARESVDDGLASSRCPDNVPAAAASEELPPSNPTPAPGSDSVPENPASRLDATSPAGSTDAAAETIAEAETDIASAAAEAGPAPAATESAPLDLSGLPVDFTTEVFAPAAALRELSCLLPLGADILGIVGEYFYLACERRTVELSRNRAVFPMRYLAGGERKTAYVYLKKRPSSDPAWTIEDVELEDGLEA